MAEHYDIAIVGSGPSGLSAGARAAQKGINHILLETSDHASDTIYKFQKKKFVMSTPDVMPLRSDVSFGAGVREDILETWDQEIDSQKN
jgi:flavin-dependent dehydrogenase